jgi:hypothetical protein
MSDRIKVRLSDKSKARDKGAEYFIIETKECIFYDSKGKELWREKEIQSGSSRFESKGL